MGVEGTFDYISDLLRGLKRRKKKQTQTVALKVRMDCEGCARKMKHVLSNVKGICDLIHVPNNILQVSARRQ